MKNLICHDNNRNKQFFSDCLAFSVDIPIRILDPNGLKNMPALFLEISKNEEYQQVYQERYKINKNQSLEANIGELGDLETLENFISQHLQTLSSLFEDLKTEFQKVQNTNVSEAAELERITTLKDIKDRVVPNIKQRYQEHILSFHQHAEALAFVLGFLEEKIWRTKTSNAIPIHLLFRMSPSWCMSVLFWVYSHREELLSNTTSHKVFDLDYWQLHTKNDSENVIFFGPVISGNTYNTTRAGNYFNKGLEFYYLFLAHQELFSIESYVFPPDRNIFTQALSKRSLVHDKVINKRVKTAFTAWKMLRNSKIDDAVFPQTPSLQGHLTRKMVLSIGRAAAFLSSLNAETYDDLDQMAIGISDEDNLAAQIAKNENGNVSLTLRKYVDQSDGDRCIFAIEGNEQVDDIAQVNELELDFNDFSHRVGARVRNYNAYRILLIDKWLDSHFGEMPVGGVLKNAIDHREHLEQFLCQTIAEITRADICSIWWCDHSNDSRLSLKGDYCQNISVLKTRDRHQSSMNEEHESSSENRKKKDYQSIRSAAYRCLFQGEWQFLPSLDETNSSLHNYPDNHIPRSAIVIPVKVDDRMIAIIEVKAFSYGQFLWTQRHTLFDIATVLGPTIYHHQLIESLTGISERILKQSESKIRAKHQLSSRLMSSLCKDICSIFLCNTAHLWIRDRKDKEMYHLVGRSDRSAKNENENLETIVSEKYNYEGPEPFLLLTVKNKNTPGYPGFSVGHYLPGKERTKFEYSPHEPSYIYDDYASSSDLRRHLFKDSGYDEIAAFHITDEKNNVIAYFTLFNSEYWGFNRSWASIVQMIVTRLEIDLSMIEISNTENASLHSVLLHEIRQDTSWLSGESNKYLSRDNFINSLASELNLILNRNSMYGSTLQKNFLNIVNKLENDSSVDKTTIETLHNWYNELRHSLDTTKKVTTEQRRLLTTLRHDMQVRSEALNKKLKIFSMSRTIPFKALFDESSSISENKVLNVHKEIKTILDSYGHIDKGGRFIANKVPKDFEITTRPGPFKRILRNLIDNAIKYASSPGTIEIYGGKGHKLTPGWHIEIKNTCSPIPERFDPFAEGSQLQDKNKDKDNDLSDPDGEGLGLYISKKIANEILDCSLGYKQEKQTIHMSEVSFKLTRGDY